MILGLWVLNLLTDAVGQLAFKAAAVDPALCPTRRWRTMACRPWVWVGAGCYVIDIGVWLAYLSVVPLSEGVLMVALSTGVVMIGGRIFFGERLTRDRVIGAALISAGVFVVGVSS